MALEIRGGGNLLADADDGRLELRAAFQLDGTPEFYPEKQDWEAQKLAYGREVAIQVADHALPRLLAQLGIGGGAVTEAPVSVRGSLDGEWQAGQISGDISDFRQRIGGVFTLTGDRELTAGELVSAARDVIAGQIANHALFALEQQFEGKQTGNTDFTVRREDGRIVDFQRREIPPAGGEAAADA